MNDVSSEESAEELQIEAVEPAWMANLEDDGAAMQVEHQWHGRTIRVWFHDKRRYYVASIWSFAGNDSFEIMYGNHQKEIVTLLPQSLKEDCTDPVHRDDPDRWSFMDEVF